MKLIDLLFPTAQASSFDDKAGWWPTSVWGGRKTSSGENVSPESSMVVSAYFACIRNVAEDLGKLPLIVFRQLPRGKERLPKHPLARLLQAAPSDEMTAMSFKETLTQWALGWGNGYAEIQRDGRGQAVGLYPIHPNRVTVRRVDGRIVYDVRSDVTYGGTTYETVRLQADEVFHLHGMGDGLVGYSIVRFAAESIGVAMAAQTFGAAFFGNGASMSGVLEHPQKLDDTARKNLRESWKEMHGGAKNSGSTAILEEGMKYSRIGIPPDEAQFLETRQFQNAEICRWFRMPPHKIQDLTRSTFTNIESQNQEYVTDTLMAWGKRWEEESKRKLLPLEPDVHAAFLFVGLLRGDHNARANYYRTMINIGAYTPNEVRELEDMNPGDDALDDHYMQSNMMPLDRIGEATTRPGAPAAADSTAPADGAGDVEDAQRQQQVDAQVAALRPVFLEAADRVLRKEVMAATKAAARFKGDASAFGRWAAEFYAEQCDFLVEAMRPALEATGSIIAGVRGAYPTDIDFRAFARDHAARSQAACVASAGAELLPENTASNLADQVIALALAKEPAHA